MRIWSIHPKYLDAKGLVALWRETLLAKNVLLGNTKGYLHHPQLLRFRETSSPVDAINHYLSFVYTEAVTRGYNFDKSKIDWTFKPDQIPVTQGQIIFEFQHLLNKLKIRDENKYLTIKNTVNPEPHPIFSLISGEIESWEKV
ncbi:MAG: hypothetical protein A2X64_11410 [Ignavibacteria bacterium GWF2_33_9]|nr:MAG: hypothetical protein A2X64_11410 [Ignavibacteria bacterium GWF2_33_9]